jgi:hypothetical protein
LILRTCLLRATKRFKDGKEHRYWSIVENRHCGGNGVVQRQVLYLGEINDQQHTTWCKTIEVVQEGRKPRQVAIIPEDRQVSMILIVMWCSPSSMSCSSCARVSGAPVGWPVRCGINFCCKTTLFDCSDRVMLKLLHGQYVINSVQVE